jgi:hypothetical protein
MDKEPVMLTGGALGKGSPGGSKGAKHSRKHVTWHVTLAERKGYEGTTPTNPPTTSNLGQKLQTKFLCDNNTITTFSTHLTVNLPQSPKWRTTAERQLIFTCRYAAEILTLPRYVPEKLTEVSCSGSAARLVVVSFYYRFCFFRLTAEVTD